MNDTCASLEEVLAQFDYLGWTPCISGHLHFDFLSPGLGEQKTQRNIDLNLSRVIYSEVDWKDTQDKNADGKFCVILQAFKTPADEEWMDGRLIIGRSTYFKKKWENDLYRIEILDQKKEDTLNAIIENEISRNSNRLYQVEFKIHKTGITLVNYSLKNPEQDAPITKHTVSRQAFYYIKYSLHKHKHHPHNNDSLTTITETSSLAPEKTVRQLTKSIIQIKRLYDCLEHKGSRYTGISAYTKSLIESLRSHQAISNERADSLTTYLNNMTDSFSVLNSESNKKRENEKSATILSLQVISVFIAVFAFYSVSYNHLHTLSPDKNLDYAQIPFKIFSSYKEAINLFLLIIAAFIYFRVEKAGIGKIGQRKLARLVLRHKHMASISFFFFGCFFYTISVFLYTHHLLQ